MGMITDEEEVSKYLTVDYRASIRHVYLSTARYALASFGLAVTARSIKRPQGLAYLPSWVPDWGLHAWLVDLPWSTFQDLLAVDGDCRTSVIVTPATNPSRHNGRVSSSSYPWSGPLEHIHCVSRLLPRLSDRHLRDKQRRELKLVEEGLRRIPNDALEDSDEFFFPYEFWSPPSQSGTLRATASYLQYLLKQHYSLQRLTGHRASHGSPDMRIAISRSGYCVLVPADAQSGDIIATCRKEKYGYLPGKQIFGCSGYSRTELLSCVFRPLSWEGDNSVEETIAKITGYTEKQTRVTHCVLVGVLGEADIHALPLDLRMSPEDINWLIIH
jgi:hypothetical protein